MDYKQKYEEALKTAKTLHGLSIQTSDDNTKMVIEELFPELGESEDERIRKELIRAFTVTADKRDCEIYGNGITYGQVLAWLEKQGEDEQKPTDKVEPKFKVGDWVVIQESTYQITKSENLNVTLSLNGRECIFHIDVLKNAHLWTIQDAKDGDVLVASDGSVFLFAGVVGCACKYYVALKTNDDIKFSKKQKGSYWETSRAVHPATEKKRKLLFSKMKEEGYEWDAEEKELRKIEQKTVEPVTVVERDGERWVRVRALGEDFIIAAHDYREGNKTNFSWEEACKIGTFSIKQAYITLALKDEINAKLKEIGGEPLDSYYWSSSEYLGYGAWGVGFSSGNVYNSNKYGSLVARAVAAF